MDEVKTWENTGTIIAVNKCSRRYTVKLDSGDSKKEIENISAYQRKREWFPGKRTGSS